MIPRPELRSHVRRSARCRAAATIAGRAHKVSPRGRVALLLVAAANGPVAGAVLAESLGVSRRTAEALADVLVEVGFLSRGETSEPSGRRTFASYDLADSLLAAVRDTVARLDPEPRR